MNKKYIWTLILFSIIAVAVPVFLYIETFGIYLTDKHENWAAFGTYFGGVLGPFFTFTSVVLLIFTLHETKLANRQQIKLIKKQYFDESFFNILNSIKLSLNSPKFKNSNSVNLFSEASLWVTKNFSIGQNTDIQQDAWNAAYKFAQNNHGIFETEIILLQIILGKLNQQEIESEKEHYFSILKGTIPNEKRFWLEAYAHVWSVEFRFLIKNISDFSELPEIIKNYITEISDNY